MFTDFYKLHEEKGFLAIMPRPRGNGWLQAEVHHLSMLSVDAVVSLLEPHEARELGLQDEQAACEANGLEYLSFPIKDRHVPEANDELAQLVSKLANKFNQGENLVIHCRAGIGRSSLIAACVLTCLGKNPESMFEDISESRKLTVPDTQEQIEWFKANYQRFQTSQP
jgi:protein-tyrosine phosphatase